MKLCINCKHCIASDISTENPEYSKCTYERPISLVTGLSKPVKDLPYCSQERVLNCGPEAKRFEPKAKPAESWATHGSIWIGEVMANKEGNHV
jgi:hypothetical protein